MLYHFLTNLIEAGILCQIRYITMHLAIDLDILHDILTIGLQTTIKVMKILDAAAASIVMTTSP